MNNECNYYKIFFFEFEILMNPFQSSYTCVKPDAKHALSDQYDLLSDFFFLIPQNIYLIKC